jgi:hypothetical protein
MTNADRIVQFLKQNGHAWCDDCLSDKTEVTHRQQIYQLGSQLAKNGVIFRDKGRCAGCGKNKTVNSLDPNIHTSMTQHVEMTKSEEKPSVDVEGHPWYWEGNIHSVLASHLARNGYRIMSIANTALRESGKDIEAITPDGKTLWVSAKGWPEKSQNTQARHWFSQALFDIILYRDESRDVDLALAFPDGFPTYLNLVKRIGWFKEHAKFKIYWISGGGSIRSE